MHDLDGMTQSEALSEVVTLRRDQDKRIGMIGSASANDLLSAAKLVREHSKRIRRVQERHFPPVVSFSDQAADDSQPTAFEMAIEGEQDALKEVLRMLEEALEKTDKPRPYARLAAERTKMADCL